MKAPVTIVAVAVALLGGLAGCGGPDDRPRAGELSVTFIPLPASVPELQLTSATMRLSHIGVFGNAPPPPGPPPPNDLAFDALDGGVRRDFMLPPGIYSRVQLAYENVVINGTWRGTPFQVRLAMMRGFPVDLRATVGRELSVDNDVAFVVDVDVGSWFAGNLLDGAVASGGQIICDPLTNPADQDGPDPAHRGPDGHGGVAGAQPERLA